MKRACANMIKCVDARTLSAETIGLREALGIQTIQSDPPPPPCLVDVQSKELFFEGFPIKGDQIKT